jgi:hypothetical protein
VGTQDPKKQYILWPDEIKGYLTDRSVLLCPDDPSPPTAPDGLAANSYGLNSLAFLVLTDLDVDTPTLQLASFQARHR